MLRKPATIICDAGRARACNAGDWMTSPAITAITALPRPMAASGWSKAAAANARGRLTLAASDRAFHRIFPQGFLPMTLVTVGTLVVPFLPFLLSLAGRGAMAKMLCLVTGILALLLSVREYAAVLPWIVGMLISGVSVWERIRQRRMA
jgi:hypothetical protein